MQLAGRILKVEASFHPELRTGQELRLLGVLGRGTEGAVYEAEVVNISNNSNTAGASLQDAAVAAPPAAASSIERVAVKVFDSSRFMLPGVSHG
jgi:hypothetical protein